MLQNDAGTFSTHNTHPLKFLAAYNYVSGKMPTHTCFIQLRSTQCVPCVKNFSGLRKQMNQAGPCSWEVLGYFRNGLMNRYSQCSLTRAGREIQCMTGTWIMVVELPGETGKDKVYLGKSQRKKNLWSWLLMCTVFNVVVLYTAGTYIHFLHPNHAPISFWGFTSMPLGLMKDGNSRCPPPNAEAQDTRACLSK